VNGNQVNKKTIRRSDARFARFFLALPRPWRPILWAVKVVSLRDLHHAQTFHFPLVADKSAASALHPAL
jgi:hypothetical protein